jgi:penicillin V acylase-like amidase (Ntn superfamily)
MKKIKSVVSLLVAGSFIFFSIANSIACTVLIIHDANGATYQGRTNEFAGMQPDRLVYFPAGTQIVSVKPNGDQGLSFNTKYAILGATLHGMTPNAKQDTLHEAVNDQGMTFTVNAFTANKSAQLDANAQNVLSIVDVGHWALGNFQNVAQVKQALQNKEVSIWLPKIAIMGNLEAPVHFALFDKTGAGIVLEFMNGQVQVYDNEVGVMTNYPPFPWHLENINNYAHLTNVDKNTGQFGKVKVTAFDSGNALASLPSSQTSPDRFIKAAYYSTYIEKAKTPKLAIQNLAHVMNNFDRPMNISIDLPGTANSGEGPPSKEPTSEATYFTVLNDLANHKYYIRTINAINYSSFDLNKLSSLKQVTVVSWDALNATEGGDATNLFFK